MSYSLPALVPEKFGTKLHVRRARNRYQFSVPISGSVSLAISTV